MRSRDSFQTQRLQAERLQSSQFDELFRMHTDERVMATLGGIFDENKQRVFLGRNLDHWQKYGFGLWVLRHRDDGRFVGRAGIRHVTVGGNEEIEIAYALLTEYWGRGLATEVGTELVAIAFEQLSLPDLVAFTMTSNWASRHLMEKLGFAFEGEIRHAELPHVLYRLRNPTP